MPRAHDRKHAPIPRRAHPDKGGDEATFVAVSEAYAVLLSARGRTVRASDESSSSDDEATRDTLSARIVDPHALFAATFGGGPARRAIGDDGYEREMTRSSKEVMAAYDVDGCDAWDAWGRYERTTAGLRYEHADGFVLERRRADAAWIIRNPGGELLYVVGGPESESAPLHGWAPARGGAGAPPRARYVRDCEAHARPATIYVRLSLSGERKLGLRLDALLRLSAVPPGSEIAAAGAETGWTCVFAGGRRVRAPNDVNAAVARGRDRGDARVLLGFRAAAADAAPPAVAADALAKEQPRSRQVGGSFREFSRFTRPLQQEADRARHAAKAAGGGGAAAEGAAAEGAAAKGETAAAAEGDTAAAAEGEAAEGETPGGETAAGAPPPKPPPPPKEAFAVPAWAAAPGAARAPLTPSALALSAAPRPTAADPDAEVAYGVVSRNTTRPSCGARATRGRRAAARPPSPWPPPPARRRGRAAS